MLQPRDNSNPQKQHYECIHEAYVDGYYDPISLRYREQFILDPLLRGLDLSRARIADIAAGSGYNSLLLKRRFPSATTVGFDISDKACRDYEMLTEGRAVQLDLTRPVVLDEGAFDYALVIGGLHHMITDLPTALRNIASLVRPGGKLLFVEPNRRFFVQNVRDLWYRLDHYFDAGSERALTLEEITKAAGDNFSLEQSYFFGGPAYFLLLNSVIFRLPHSVKRSIGAPLMLFEGLFAEHGNSRLGPAFAGSLIRNPRGV